MTHQRPLIICEVGLNHCGSKEYSDRYLDILLRSACDALTVQVRESSFYQQAERKHLRMPDEYYVDFCNKIRKTQKKIGIAIADEDKIDFFEELGVDFYKILSKDFRNASFVETIIKKTKKPLYFSTGLASDENIKGFIALVGGAKDRIHLIHTQLTNEIDQVNIRAIDHLKSLFGEQVAFGNHCSNYRVLYLALVLNPCALFLYAKGDTVDMHPDEAHAIPLAEIPRVIDNLLELHKAIGSGGKMTMANTIPGQNL